MISCQRVDGGSAWTSPQTHILCCRISRDGFMAFLLVGIRSSTCLSPSVLAFVLGLQTDGSWFREQNLDPAGSLGSGTPGFWAGPGSGPSPRERCAWRAAASCYWHTSCKRHANPNQTKNHSVAKLSTPLLSNIEVSLEADYQVAADQPN